MVTVIWKFGESLLNETSLKSDIMKSMESKDFDYKKLNNVLKQRGIDVGQLAKMTGKTKKAVKPWLNGTVTPHKSSLEKIISVLHISPEAISKEGSVVASLETDVILETLDYLLNIYMPFFAYYKKNNEEYQLKKQTNQLNKINSSYGNPIKYGFLREAYEKKVSLDRELIRIIEAIEAYINKEDFPLTEMKEVSKNMIFELAIERLREVDSEIEESEMYRSTCLSSIKSIDNDFKNSPQLQRALGEQAIFDISKELSDEQKIKIEQLRYTLGIVINIFLRFENIQKDIVYNELMKYPYFTALYLLGYDSAIKEQILYPMISKEFYLYLKWRVYKTDDYLFAEELLQSIQQKINKFSPMTRTEKIIEALLDGALLPLIKKDCRLACVEYIKKCDQTKYSLTLYAILESLPMQWSEKD